MLAHLRCQVRRTQRQQAGHVAAVTLQVGRCERQLRHRHRLAGER
jgi:hypothetical protein